MPPYEGYQQPGYGSNSGYGQAQRSQFDQDRMNYMMQQQQARVVIPSSQPVAAPHPRQAPPPQAWQPPHPDFQRRQPPPPPQHQAYYHPPQGQPHPQPSLFEQFAAGHFRPPTQQEYWRPSPQGVDYQVPFQQPQHIHTPRQAPAPQQTHRKPHVTYQSPRQTPHQFCTPRPQANQQTPQQRTPSQPSLSQPAQSSGATQLPFSSQDVPRQRMIAHVQSPAQQSVDMAPKPQHSRSPKRRCSNERKPVHIKQESVQPPPRNISKRQQRPPDSSPHTELNSSQLPPTPSADVDYQDVLLSLSDEYVAAAHSMSGHLYSDAATEDDYEQYHKMLATAMGCLESVLANYRQKDPRKEARVRLRLATLLFEETENNEEAEDILGKGIALCQRERLIDTKYAMEHLLIRVVSKSSPKAAFKLVEKLVSEAESYGHHMWVYALRFLRISLSVEADGPLDAFSVLRHLSAISNLADMQQQVAAQVASATLEAIVHLRVGGVDAVELAQRSLASARTHQFEPGMQQMPQLSAALDCLDLACNFAHNTLEQRTEKLARMHTNLDATTKLSGWASDGTFIVPLGFQHNRDVESDTGGIFRVSNNGLFGLSFKWLSRSQLYMIGYLLSGFTALTNNSENKKAENFLAEGLKLDKPLPTNLQLSLSAHEGMRLIQRQAGFSIELTRIFAYCGRSAWAAASEAITALHEKLSDSPVGHDDFSTATLLYLGGVCKQGLGDLTQALELYSSPKLAFDPNAKHSPPLKDIRCLAALNSVFILRSLPSPHPETAAKIIERTETHCLTHPNKSIQSAFYLLRTHTCSPDTPIIKTKQHLQNSLAPAQAVKNSQLLSIIMNTMTNLFFKDIVGKQAVGSANAGKQLSNKIRDPLWQAVAEGMYRELLERGGDFGAVRAIDSEARRHVSNMPEGVRRGIGLEE